MISLVLKLFLAVQIVWGGNKSYRLTTVLASSLLQLQTTPWIRRKPEKKDIFFEYNDSEVFTDRPYVQQSFLSTKRTPPAPSADPQLSGTTRSTTATERFAARASLIQLGIILLELCFRQPNWKPDLVARTTSCQRWSHITIPILSRPGIGSRMSKKRQVRDSRTLSAPALTSTAGRIGRIRCSHKEYTQVFWGL